LLSQTVSTIKNTQLPPPPAPEETTPAEWARGYNLDENTQIDKTVDQLTPAELQRVRNMNIDIEAVDSVTITLHCFFVSTGAKAWQAKRLNTKHLELEQMQKLKTRYKELNNKLKSFETSTSKDDLPAIKDILQKFNDAYEAIVAGGYPISREESLSGFEFSDKQKTDYPALF